jgi:hypothetical protein
MSFEVIAEPRCAADYAPMWLQDMLPADATREHIARAYAHHIIGDMGRPKTMATVRKHMLAVWPFLQRLGEEQPGLFDEVLLRYAEVFLGGE